MLEVLASAVLGGGVQDEWHNSAPASQRLGGQLTHNAAVGREGLRAAALAVHVVVLGKHAHVVDAWQGGVSECPACAW